MNTGRLTIISTPIGNLGDMSQRAVDSLQSALRKDTLLVSLMHINNELGTINDIAALGALIQANGTFFHVDAAQSLGKLAFDLSDLPVDLMSF